MECIATVVSLQVHPERSRACAEDEDTQVCKEENLELEVRWMTTGTTVCTLRTSSKLDLCELRTQVHEHAGIPVEEQRLFWTSGPVIDGDSDIVLHATPADVFEVTSAHGSSTDKALLLVRCTSDPRITNLGSFRSKMTFPALPSGSFTKVRKISEGINGNIMLYQWHREGGDELVAVKMLRNDGLDSNAGTETDERVIHMECSRNAPQPEDVLTEIGLLSYLSHQVDLPRSLLKMRGVFAGAEFTWLVTEFADGGELFDVAASGAVPEPQLKQWISELLQAVEYLHCHCISHRDISLENILLKDGQIKLMDFGMAVRSQSPSGTPLRYFRAVGKDFYRAPECYVPKASELRVKVPSDGKGGDVIMTQATCGDIKFLCEVRLPTHASAGKHCNAEVWGYTPVPADIWAVAICCIILGFQCPPWNCAMIEDPSFGYVHAFGKGGLESVLTNWGKQLLSREAMQFLASMLEEDPRRRPSAAQCLENLWFAERNGATDVFVTNAERSNC